MFARWISFVIRNRVIVLLTWVVIAILGTVGASQLTPYLSTTLNVPGSQSEAADHILTNNFHDNIEGTFTVLYKFRNATPTQMLTYRSAIESAAKTIPTARVTQQREVSGVLFASITTSYSLNRAASYTDQLRGELIRFGLKGALVSGPPAINRDVSPVLNADLTHGQVIALLIALVLLLIGLGFSLAVLLPFIFAAATITASVGIVFILAQQMIMVRYIPNIIELIGLGLAIDYSLLIVHRFRKELIAHPSLNPAEAISITMATAGKTVVLSGVSVSMALATLLLVPVPFVRSLGAAGIVVPLVSVITAITLQPALLSLLGRRGALAYKWQGAISHDRLLSQFWRKITIFVIRKPGVIVLSALSLLLLAAAPLYWLEITPSALSAIPQQLESARGIAMMTERAGPGVITPFEVIVDLGASELASTEAMQNARRDFASRILRDPEVFIVATDNKFPFVDESGRYLRIFVVGRHDLGAPRTKELVRTLRLISPASAGFSEATKIYIGGAPAQGVDLLNKIFSSFFLIALLILMLSYIYLVRAFQSLLLPLKAILMDLLSIAVAFSSIVLVFRFHIGSSFLGNYQLDQVEVWVLVFLFAVMFGISMDYEVFIVSRMREEVLKGATTKEAVVEGMANTAGVVTAAAVILVAALGGLIFGSIGGLQQLGLGLSIGVLVDATVIRGLILPSAMVLFDRWNWWLPISVARLLKVKASPLVNPMTRL